MFPPFSVCLPCVERRTPIILLSHLLLATVFNENLSLLLVFDIYPPDTPERLLGSQYRGVIKLTVSSLASPLNLLLHYPSLQTHCARPLSLLLHLSPPPSSSLFMFMA